jgi:hypothetical protein
MKTLITAIVLAVSLASSASAQGRYYLPSYECGPAQYDSSGTPIPQYCDY